MKKNRYGYETNSTLEEADKALATECIDYRLGIDVGTTRCPGCEAHNEDFTCGGCPLDDNNLTKVSGLCQTYCQTIGNVKKWLEGERRSITRMKTTPSKE